MLEKKGQEVKFNFETNPKIRLTIFSPNSKGKSVLMTNPWLELIGDDKFEEEFSYCGVFGCQVDDIELVSERPMSPFIFREFVFHDMGDILYCECEGQNVSDLIAAGPVLVSV